MSTSTNDVFEIRNEISDAKAFEDANMFVKANLPEHLEEHDVVEKRREPLLE